MPEADRSASPPSSTRPPEGVDVSLNFGHVVSFLCGAIVPESDRSALLEFDPSSAVLWVFVFSHELIEKSASEVQHAPRSTVLQAVFVAVSAAGAPRRYPSAPVAPGSEPYVQGLEHMPLYTPVPSTRVPGVLTWFYHRVAM